MRKEVKNMSLTFEQFVDYVESFYGNVPDAIYPISAIREMISNAVEIYFDAMFDSVTWGGGDSLDRERVRDIMIEKYNLEWK